MSKHLRHPALQACPKPPSPLLRPASALTSAAVLATLVACGGGGSGDSNSAASPPPSPAAPPAAVQWSGKVAIDQGIKNAKVCADLNANSSCDSSEPTQAATGADGAFQLSYQPTDTASESSAKAAALLAVIAALILPANGVSVPVFLGLAVAYGVIAVGFAIWSGRIGPELFDRGTESASTA